MIDKEKCKQCIWTNDETGNCDKVIGFPLFLAPYWKQNPHLKPRISVKGISGDDCVGFEHRPTLRPGERLEKQEVA